MHVVPGIVNSKAAYRDFFDIPILKVSSAILSSRNTISSIAQIFSVCAKSPRTPTVQHLILDRMPVTSQWHIRRFSANLD